MYQMACKSTRSSTKVLKLYRQICCYVTTGVNHVTYKINWGYCKRKRLDYNAAVAFFV